MFPFNNGRLFPHFTYCLNYELANQGFYSLDMNAYNSQIQSPHHQINFHNFEITDPNHILAKITDSIPQRISKHIGSRRRKIKRLKNIPIEQEFKNFTKDL